MTTDHPLIRPQPGVLQVAPYQGGDSALSGLASVLKLSSNENPAGPSPRAIEAFRAAAGDLALYPDGGQDALRAAIAGVYGLDPAHIVGGAGSDELISLLCHAYAGPGDEVVHSAHGFAMYSISARTAGATPVSVPEDARRADLGAMRAACTERTRLVFLANPNNPTGTMVPPEEVAELAASLPPAALLVLDSAYAEYVAGYDGGAALVEARDNVVMLRTFSKIHGIAALRVGWAYAPGHVIAVLQRMRGPFNVSLPGLAAAQAAIEDTDWVARCVAENARWRGWLADALAEAGVASDPSEGNFVLARLADAEEARACDAALRAAGIIVRGMAGYGLPQALRITVGDEAACQRVAQAVQAFRAAPATAAAGSAS
ncbi:MAG: histidinol-phosphate transaminase [Pseudomonadota bacterium]